MTKPSPSQTPTRSARPLVGVFALVLLCTLPACQKTLLHKNDPRSPFDRYNQSRTQHAEPFLEDEFGRRTPNLRGRLVKSEE